MKDVKSWTVEGVTTIGGTIVDSREIAANLAMNLVYKTPVVGCVTGMATASEPIFDALVAELGWDPTRRQYRPSTMQFERDELERLAAEEMARKEAAEEEEEKSGRRRRRRRRNRDRNRGE